MAREPRKSDDAVIRTAFGKVLRRLRTAQCLTQEELADRSNSTTNYVSLLERGIEGPSLIRVFDFATALGTSPQDLITAVDAEVRRSHEAAD